MLQFLTDLYLTGVVFNRVSQDAGIDMFNVEQFTEYLASLLIVKAKND